MAVNSFREDEYMENTDKKKILSRLLSYLLDCRRFDLYGDYRRNLTGKPIADRRGD